MFNRSDFFFQSGTMLADLFSHSAFFFFCMIVNIFKYVFLFVCFFKSAYFFGIRNSGISFSQTCYRIVEFLLALLGIHFSWASDLCNFYPPL